MTEFLAEMPMRRFHKLTKDERAATAIEYALVGALTAIIAIAGVQATGVSINNMFTFVADNVIGAMTG